jgi:molybdopterin synthase catalytic subunit
LERPFFAITEEPIDVGALTAQVVDARHGAVVTFVGVVRGFSRGKEISYLEYEAYEGMAVKKMAEVADQIRERWGLDRVAIVHRIGRLAIGEASIAIAVASPHRHEAFEACEYAINTVKRTVPVWKKEVWSDGEVWIGLETQAQLEREAAQAQAR